MSGPELSSAERPSDAGRATDAPPPARAAERHGGSAERGSLTRRTLAKMAVRISLVLLATTAFGYHHIISGMTAESPSELSKYVIARGQREREVFKLAVDNMQVFREAYIKRLTALGGAIWLDSELGKGSVFYVRLPIDGARVVETAPAKPEDEENEPPAPEVAKGAAPDADDGPAGGSVKDTRARPVRLGAREWHGEAP